jgi:FtsH-binding integral membrane protein
MERWMRNTPLFRERPRSMQALIGLVVPFAFGAVAGVVLGISAAAYWAIGLLALVGGVLAGFEHADGWDGADRGLVGGTLYGVGLLLAHWVAGSDAQVSLPGFAPILVVFTAIIGMFAGALGGRLRREAMQRSGSAAPAPVRRPA